MMMKIIKKYGFHAGFIALGAFLGYLYWFHVGCNSGGCPITSVWYNSSIAGAIMGYLSGDLAVDFYKKKKEKNEKIQENN
ncbi:MAG: DUF6132 family protein [Bacteroidota bacterium]